ncbi:hypothetical protein AK812_SmicGene41324 [Symbiodinium microadriaticum]|uniref:Uncharacterized protein n=1 Tax=Symbiodinium microadriaticum TaxID=2951 RepID=A0A1Q9C6E7_SYMMI|nr:hypothetical protein AK812_SmicGene41324 [Symbiodinium microadriaticum]
MRSCTRANHEAEAQAKKELLQAAAEAFHGAPNRAVKRRIRQRLHKKLGTILNREQFEKAMDRFWTLEEEHEVIEEVIEVGYTGCTWERALSEKVELPVVRTFIQFDTCPREHLRRSKSVPR